MNAPRIAQGSPVTTPGVPKNYPDAKKLVMEDCIQPSHPEYKSNLLSL